MGRWSRTTVTQPKLPSRSSSSSSSCTILRCLICSARHKTLWKPQIRKRTDRYWGEVHCTHLHYLTSSFVDQTGRKKNICCKGRPPLPFCLFFYKVYRRPLASPPPPFYKITKRFFWIERTVKKCENTCRNIIRQNNVWLCEENFQIYPNMLITLLLFCDNSNLKRPFNVNFMLPNALQNIQN